MKKDIRNLIVLIMFFLLLIFVLKISMHKEYNKIEKLNLDHIDKLMIVAHPDDEMIWGGSNLLDDDYLVVCITCGNSKRRVKEFKKVMNETNDKFLMLYYPDKTNGKKDNWKKVYADIEKDLTKIINYKKWSLVVTHNKEGEYGHIQHIMTNKMVTNNIGKNNLYYFGDYYRKKKVPNDLKKINDKDYDLKNKILYENYKSQKRTLDMFNHMFEYENWVKYEEE